MLKFVESETVELKRTYKDSLIKEIVAFLNASGGTIYIGVNDDGTICGAEKIDETLRSIADIVSSQIEPIPNDLITTQIVFEDKLPIIQITVSKGFHALYCIKKYGYSQAGCLIRIGTSNKEMSNDQIQIRYQKRFESSRDYMTTIPSSYGDISFDTLQILLRNRGYHINQNSFETNYNLRNEKGQYNQLAELLSDHNMIPVIFVKFRGSEKTSVSERTDYGKISLIAAYFNLKNRFISENICMTDTTIRPRKDIHLYDIDAVDEAIINALVHNDWSITEPLFSMFNDRLEIVSHGGLPYKQTKEQFLNGVSIPRNAALMRIFQDLDITEHTGHGIPKIIEVYGKNAFTITDSYIKVTIPFNPLVMSNHGTLNNNISNAADSSLLEEEQNLLPILVLNPKTTLDKAAELLGVSKRTVSRFFSSLQKKGYIKREGSNKNGLWIVLK